MFCFYIVYHAVYVVLLLLYVSILVIALCLIVLGPSGLDLLPRVSRVARVRRDLGRAAARNPGQCLIGSIQGFQALGPLSRLS